MSKDVLLLIERLRGRGIQLRGEHGQLKITAPKGALDAATTQLLRDHKAEVLTWLTQLEAGTPGGIPKADLCPDTPVPATVGQQRLWLLTQQGMGSAYHIAAGLRLQGELDEGALRAAVAHCLQQHAALRTRLVERDGRLWQQVQPEGPELEVVDTPGADAVALLHDYAEPPFDLAQHAPARLRLLRCGPREQVLLICVHHSAIDGWGLGLVLEHLGRAYAALAQGQEPSWPTASLSMADVALWQQRQDEQGAHETALAYWQAQLAERPEPLRLSPREAAPDDWRGGQHLFELPATLAHDLQRLASASRITLYHWLLASYKLLLGKYCGQREVALLVPVANRQAAGLQDLVGLLTNTVPSVSVIDSRLSLRQWAQQESDTTLQALAHHGVPFERIVQHCRAQGLEVPAHLMFSLQTVSELDLQLPGLQGELLRYQASQAKFDLNLTVEQRGERLLGVLEYRQAVLDEDQAATLAQAYVRLLEQVVQAPDRPLGAVALAPARVEPYVPVAEGPSVIEQIYAQVARTPDAPAVVQGTHALSYAQLWQQVSGASRALRDAGIGRGQQVGVLLPPGPSLVVAALAAHCVGAAYAPLDLHQPTERLALMVQDARLDAVFALPGSTPLGEALWLALNLESAVDLEPVIPAPADARDPAYLIFTSGSTGRPKAARVHQRGLTQLVQWYRETCVDANTRVLVISNPSFDLTQKNLLAPLTCGAVVGFPAAERFDPQAIAQALQAQRSTLVNCTPTAFQTLLLQAEADPQGDTALRSLRHVVLGGEPIALQPLRRWQQRHGPVQIVNSYGPTECSDVVAYELLPLDLAQATAPIAIGVAVPGCRLEVVDFDAQPLPPGAVGELRIDGDCVGLGYVGRDELTAQLFRSGGCGVNGWRYHSGDLVQQQADGRLQYLGRRDQQIKLNGYRIELGEVEAALLALEGIAQAAVAVRRDARGNAVLAAFYVGREGHNTHSEDGLRQALAGTLASYQVPARYVALEALPLTRSGKVDRNALPQQLPERVATTESDDATPLNPREHHLAAVWAQLLGLERLPRRDDDFFALGGHSMLALELVRALREQHQLRLSVDLVFRHPTLQTMAGVLEDTPPDVQHPLLQVDAATPVALTPLQRRLWFLFRLEGPNASYNMSAAYRLRGRPDVPALLAALRDVVTCHWILRSRLQQSADQPLPMLAVGDVADVPIVQTSAPADQVRDQVAAFLARPFDLAHEALARFELLRVSNDECLLLANLHHIVCDGLSLRTLFADLGRAYTLRRRGGATLLDDNPPLQFAQLAASQARDRDDAAYRRQRDELTAALRDAPHDSSLPTDWPRQRQQTDRAAGRIDLSLPPSLRAQIQALAAAHATSGFCVLLASWCWLLSRYRRQHDVVVGVPIVCRDEPGSEDVIGPLLNTLAVRVDGSDTPHFSALIDRTARALEFARERRRVSFEDLVDALNPPRMLDLSPVFQTQFVMDPVDVGALALDPLEVQALGAAELGAETGAKYDLNLHLFDSGRDLSGYLDYRRALYHRSTIEGVAQAWLTLLQSLTQQPERPLAEHTLLDPPSWRALQAVVQRVDPDLPTDQTVHRLFEQQVRRTPEAVALSSRVEGELHYAELDARANQLAHRLLAEGLRGGEVVAVLQGRGHARIVTLLAVLKAGAAYLPVDPEWPSERRRLVLDQARCGWAIVDEGQRQALAASAATVAARVLSPWSPADRVHPSQAPAVTVGGNSPCYLMFTSGSTGVPKGVLIRHGGVAHDLLFLIRKLGLGPGDRVLQLTSFSFDPSVRDLFATLGSGATAVVVDDETAKHPARIVAALQSAHATHVLSMVPTLLRALLAEADADTTPWQGGLRVLGLNGERLRGDDCERARRRFGTDLHILNQYGPTEATMTSATHLVQEADTQALTVPLGTPNPNTSLYVMDEQGQPLPVGAIGEIWISGPGLADGYTGQPEQSAASFVSRCLPHQAQPTRFYRTGDLGRWRGDGVLEFQGRVDFQIKLRGHRIELGEIDACLGQQPGIAHCASTLYEDGAGRQWLCAFYTPAEPGVALDVGLLKQALARRLPAAMVPTHFIERATLPLTSSGKVDRKRLPDPAPFVNLRTSGGSAPADAVERQIAAVWAELLDLAAAPNREANFFELGANSLSMVQARDRLAQQFGEQLSVVDLFQHPSIAALAAHLRGSTSGAPVVPGGVDADKLDRRREFLQQRAGRQRPASRPLQDRLRHQD
ncbi:non-ribosomal peptide synthetase [Caldimonas brevitalea]|uniref:Non-ribosomal peptide synthetase n=1 Tax=Caldimonas brevitalea TaxID=413882 RepID=A0A0G3BNH0_9BURK|nr:non-ribosomal peptide synthetase [Caldimonas brevitalea]AKJ30947.1 non-ribosomal peptide synthetase [Caldimonas brevitalea]